MEFDPRIVAWAVPAIPFVMGTVSALKIAAGRRTPPWVQIVNALLSGQLYVLLFLVFNGTPMSAPTIAGAMLAGVYAFMAAAGLSEMGKAARKAV